MQPNPAFSVEQRLALLTTALRDAVARDDMVESGLLIEQRQLLIDGLLNAKEKDKGLLALVVDLSEKIEKDLRKKADAVLVEMKNEQRGLSAQKAYRQAASM